MTEQERFDSMRDEIIDLKNEINRLQAENEALINGQETLQKYIAEQKAENERLKYCNETNISSIATLHEQLKTAKAEAYKECIEKVDKELSLLRRKCRNDLDDDGVFAIDRARKKVNNLLKELVGDNNG